MALVRLCTSTLAILLLTLASAPTALALARNADVAALQVALRAVHEYAGPVDGLAGPSTSRAVRSFQSHKHLHPDGVAGLLTRRALGRRGRPSLGTRVLKRGASGWDVAAVQFLLAERGYSSGAVDGGYGAATEAAVRRFQSAARIGADGRVGHSTIAALERPNSHSTPLPGRHVSSTPSAPLAGPVRFLRPLNVPMGDGFGPRGGRMHTGIDFPAPQGTPIGAAGRGVVKFAGWNSGGYGNLVVVSHRLGFETWYAHLSAFAVRAGQAVSGGSRIGSVGSTGHASGPHVHFEVRLNGLPINPLPYLLSSPSLRRTRVAGVHRECQDTGSAAAFERTLAPPATAELLSCRP